MGGYFSPSLPPPPPPPPAPPPASDPEEEARNRRIEALNRRRRGRAGTIRTSSRGLVGLNDMSQNRKTLLGD